MAKVSWIFTSTPYYTSTPESKVLRNNPVDFALLEGQPDFAEFKLNNLQEKIVFRKKYGDPRLVHHHKFQLSYNQMDKKSLDILMNNARFFGSALHLKIWQFDAKYDLVASDSTGAVLCWPKGDNTFYEYFSPYRNLASDEADKTKVWVNNVIKTLGIDYTIDYIGGKITFLTQCLSSDVVSAHFVWNPKVVILSLDPRPAPGRPHNDPRYSPVIILKES